jgi:hypothetical protein
MSKPVRGGGWITDALSKIPAELHIPGYNFCGPNTKLKERLARGDTGINPLDNACLDHDIVYSKTRDADERRIADNILAEKAWKRVKSSDASIGEKLSSMLVTGAMKAKVMTGGAMKNSPTKKRKVVKKTRVNKGKKSSKKSTQLLIQAAKKSVQKAKKTANKTPRIIPIPKTGGILPFLIPLFAGLSATGALAGGAAAVAKAVNAAKSAGKTLEEMKKHNETMEAIALGKTRVKKGKGFYLRPYKNGYGIAIKKSKN